MIANRGYDKFSEITKICILRSLVVHFPENIYYRPKNERPQDPIDAFGKKFGNRLTLAQKQKSRRHEKQWNARTYK
jgi:hypothetical protein